MHIKQTTNPDVVGNHAETQAHTPGITATLKGGWYSRQAMVHETDTTTSGFQCFFLVNILEKINWPQKKEMLGL